MYYESKVGDRSVAKLAWNACRILLPCALFLVVVFFSTIKKEYRETFWSMKRGKDVTLSYFESSEDSTKAAIFHHNYRHWKEIEDKVEEWVRENWKRWMEEEPDWIDENMKAMIPLHMIPNIKDRGDVKDFRNGKGRRSTVLQSLAGLSRRHTMIGSGGLGKVATTNLSRSTAFQSLGRLSGRHIFGLEGLQKMEPIGSSKSSVWHSLVRLNGRHSFGLKGGLDKVAPEV